MSDRNNPPCIGLFGTCGNSTWRKRFTQEYDAQGIRYYNPQVGVGEWTPENALEERRHLAEDSIILFPVTGETYGTGSLAETGFSILSALDLNSRRDVIVMIQEKLDPSLSDKVAGEESRRARKLVKAHLAQRAYAGLFVVDSLDDMLELSLNRHTVAMLNREAERFRTKNS